MNVIYSKAYIYACQFVFYRRLKSNAINGNSEKNKVSQACAFKSLNNTFQCSAEILQLLLLICTFMTLVSIASIVWLALCLQIG